MYIFKSATTPRLLRCLLLLMLVLCQHCQAETVSVTGSFNTSELTYSGLTYDLTGLSGKTDTAIVNIFSPIIKGNGVYFKGFSSYTLSQAAPALKLNLTDSTVTNAPIKITGWFPPHSYTTISGTKAKMLGDSILFDFRTLVPKDNVMFFVVNTVAEWTTLPGGVVLALIDEKVRVLIEIKSGFYLLRVNATGAMNMVKLYGEVCDAIYCFDVYNGLFAVDYANCTNCNGPFFDAGLQMVSGSQNAMTRFQNCTHQTGNNQPFFYRGGNEYLLFSLGEGANLIFSSITTDGDLFYVPNKRLSNCSFNTQLVLQHINATGHGLGWDFYNSLRSTCDIYVGNLTFNNVSYTEPSQFDSLKIEYTKIVDVFGKTVSNARTAGDNSAKGQYSLVYCLRQLYTGVEPELVPSDKQNQQLVAEGFPAVQQWSRAHCTCKDGGFPPYCTEVYDPLLYPVGYTFITEKCTTDPVSCKQCRWGEWGTCGECNPGYKFNNAGECIPKGCNVANCQTCVFDEEDKCQTCDDKYKLSGSNCVQKTCAKLPCTQCTSVSGNTDKCQTCTSPFAVNPSTQQCDACEPGYKWNAGTSQCDPKQCNVANCQTCVFDEEDKCQTCDDKYKLSGSNCVQKTCAKLPCTQCTSVSGNTDKCQTCTSPFAVNPSTQQCDACEPGYKWNAGTSQCDPKQCNVANCQTCVFDEEDKCQTCDDKYKLSGSNCVQKTCAKLPCTQCTSVSGNTDKCQTCTSPFAVNPSTQQCDACEPGYKWNAGTSQCDPKQCNVANCQTCVFDEEDKCQTCDDKYKLSGSNCVQKTCAKLPCTQCTSVSGNTDKCQTCTSPFAVNPSTQQCDACEPGYKWNAGTSQCDPKQCNVANCQTCVFDEEDKCQTCDGKYKLSGSNCVQKTCAKLPCTQCTSVSGNTDKCQTCTSPFAVNPSTQQCDACEPGYKYKLSGSSCVQKTCAKLPCTQCTSVSGNTDKCQTCTSPFAVNPSTQQCDACEPGYKWNAGTSQCDPKQCNVANCQTCVFDEEDKCQTCDDKYKLSGSNCVQKTCAKAPCVTCEDESGNTDICTSCDLPHILNNATQQCDACEPGLKYIQENATCVKKQCLVEDCTECVFDEEYQCKTCEGDLEVNDDAQCSAMSDNKKLSGGIIAGIIIAVIVVLLIVFLLIFFLCCRKQRRSYEDVEHMEMKNRASVEGNDLPSVKVEEETEVTLMSPEGGGDERNPLQPKEETHTSPSVVGGRRARRARSVRRAQTEVADVDLDAMYSKDNEIEENL